MAKSQQTEEEIIMCVGGAFNPVHTQHVQMLNLAKSHLESNQKNLNIIAGFLAPAPDGYVKRKLRTDRAMKAEHRLLMCKLAAKVT